MTTEAVRSIASRGVVAVAVERHVARLALGSAAPAAIAQRLDPRLFDAPDFSAALRCQIDLARDRSRAA